LVISVYLFFRDHIATGSLYDICSSVDGSIRIPFVSARSVSMRYISWSSTVKIGDYFFKQRMVVTPFLDNSGMMNLDRQI